MDAGRLGLCDFRLKDDGVLLEHASQRRVFRRGGGARIGFPRQRDCLVLDRGWGRSWPVDVSTTAAASRSSAVVGGSEEGWSVCWRFSSGRRSRVHTRGATTSGGLEIAMSEQLTHVSAHRRRLHGLGKGFDVSASISKGEQSLGEVDHAAIAHGK